jgi:hypothetical protein
VLFISQNNAHIGKLAKSQLPQLSGTITRVRKVKNRGNTATGDGGLTGSSCVKRKKENDIERVTGKIGLKKQ